MSDFRPKLITFDCANTLIGTDWRPDLFAIRCAARCGIEISGDQAGAYLKMWMGLQPESFAVNAKRDLESWRAFWVGLGENWLRAVGMEPSLAKKIHAVAEDELFSVPSDTFWGFNDVIPTLSTLKNQGYTLAVVSNWDHSLHGCLAAHGIAHYFSLVLASLEEGYEKPDSRLFMLACNHFGVTSAETLHVGDDPIDDLQGAENAGIKSVLIDRTAEFSKPKISSLTQLEEAFTWFN